eukprot:3127238-Pyramimonas_sp.AAC.1
MRASGSRSGDNAQMIQEPKAINDMASWGPLGRPVGGLFGSLGGLLGRLGAMLGVLPRSVADSGPSWTDLGSLRKPS